MEVMLRLKTVKHPISEETIGFRIQAAVPNKAGKAFGKPIPSFKKPYFISETSDYSEDYLKENFDKVVDRVKSDLQWQGYQSAGFI